MKYNKAQLEEMVNATGKNCKILPLEGCKGYVDGVVLWASGQIKYSVDYYHNGDRKSLWFRDFEIELID